MNKCSNEMRRGVLLWHTAAAIITIIMIINTGIRSMAAAVAAGMSTPTIRTNMAVAVAAGMSMCITETGACSWYVC